LYSIDLQEAVFSILKLSMPITIANNVLANTEYLGKLLYFEIIFRDKANADESH
jgi:hypothetical protein